MQDPKMDVPDKCFMSEHEESLGWSRVIEKEEMVSMEMGPKIVGLCCYCYDLEWDEALEDLGQAVPWSECYNKNDLAFLLRLDQIRQGQQQEDLFRGHWWGVEWWDRKWVERSDEKWSL